MEKKSVYLKGKFFEKDKIIDPYHSISKQKILPVEPLIQCEAGQAKTMQRQSLYSPWTPKWPPRDKGELASIMEVHVICSVWLLVNCLMAVTNFLLGTCTWILCFCTRIHSVVYFLLSHWCPCKWQLAFHLQSHCIYLCSVVCLTGNPMLLHHAIKSKANSRSLSQEFQPSSTLINFHSRLARALQLQLERIWCHVGFFLLL